MKLRLFVGMTAPPEWKQAIMEWRRGVQGRFGASFGRWTSEANLHLTLRFFGSVEESEVVAVAKTLQEVAASSRRFELRPGEFGCFPNASRPRIFWLGFAGANEELVTLEMKIQEATAAFGQAPENRPFHPHLTLARLKEPTRGERDALAELIREGNSMDVEPWRVERIELIRSEPKPDGSVYTELAGLPLR